MAAVEASNNKEQIAAGEHQAQIPSKETYSINVCTFFTTSIRLSKYRIVSKSLNPSILYTIRYFDTMYRNFRYDIQQRYCKVVRTRVAGVFYIYEVGLIQNSAF